MKKLFLLFAVVAIGLASCKKEEHTIRYEVTTDNQVDSLIIQRLAGKNYLNIIDSGTVMINSMYWTKTISDADVSTGTHYEIKALYHGQQYPGNVNVKIYYDDNLIKEDNAMPMLIDGVTWYAEPSCVYIF